MGGKTGEGRYEKGEEPVDTLQMLYEDCGGAYTVLVNEQCFGCTF